jgi:hypothetical protein
MSARRRLLVGSALLVTTLGAGFTAVNFGLDDSQVNAYAMTGDVHEVVVRSDSGNVDLVPGTGRVSVRETQHFVSEKPELDRTLKRGVLTIDSHCGTLVLRCYADLQVRVPPRLKVTVQADSGHIRSAWANVREIRVDGDSGDIDLRLAGRQSRVYAHTDSGDVKATVRARAVDARTDSGDVSIHVPRGDYKVDADTDSGDVEVVGISRNDHAAKSITASSDSGDVNVRSRRR